MDSETAVVQIAPQNDAGVAALVDNISELLKYAQTRSIGSLEDVTIATEDLTIMANLKKAVYTKKEEYTRPLMTHLDGVRDVFKSIHEPLAQASQILRAKVLAYQAKVQRKADEATRIAFEERRLAEEKAALNGTPVAEVEQVQVETPQPTTKGELGDSGQAMITKWEVTAFALVPDDYKKIDEGVLTPVVKASKGKITIPGIRIWQEPTLQVRPKKTTGNI